MPVGKTLGHRSRRVGKVFWAVYSPAELRNLGVGLGAREAIMGGGRRRVVFGACILTFSMRSGWATLPGNGVIHCTALSDTTQCYPESLMETQGQTAE